MVNGNMTCFGASARLKYGCENTPSLSIVYMEGFVIVMYGRKQELGFNMIDRNPIKWLLI